MKLKAFWDIAQCGLVEVDRRPSTVRIYLMIEAVRTSETSVDPKRQHGAVLQKVVNLLSTYLNSSLLIYLFPVTVRL
jgi:hypothetical protein